jgi:hypothetical protein
MPLATAATGIGKQVVTHAVRTWLGARRERSETLDELEQFGIDVRRYKPRTLVSVAYLSLQVSTDPHHRGRGDHPDERWFIDGRRTVTSGSSSLRADAGSGKTTLLQWLAVTAAGAGSPGRWSTGTGPCRSWSGCAAMPTVHCRDRSSCSPGSR